MPLSSNSSHLSCFIFSILKIKVPQRFWTASYLWNDSVCWNGLTYGERPLSFAVWWTWAHSWFRKCQNGCCLYRWLPLITIAVSFSRWLLSLRRLPVSWTSLIETWLQGFSKEPEKSSSPISGWKQILCTGK